MIRLLPAIAVACALMTACSSDSPPPSSAAGDKGAPERSPSSASPAATPPSAPADAPPASAPASTPAAAPTPETASSSLPEPTVREVTIPADTTLTVKLTTPVASDTSKVEDPVSGTLARPIVVSGTTAVPAGAKVTGTVLEADRSGRVKGRASIAFRFDHLVVGGERHQIQTNRIAREAAADTKGDLKKGGIGAGAGAVIGGIAGGGKGAAIGGAIGGSGAVMATRGKEIRLAAGTTVSATLQEPLTVQVPVRNR